MERQLSEALRIEEEEHSSDILMNQKGEWGVNSLPRLTILEENTAPEAQRTDRNERRRTTEEERTQDPISNTFKQRKKRRRQEEREREEETGVQPSYAARNSENENGEIPSTCMNAPMHRTSMHATHQNSENAFGYLMSRRDANRKNMSDRNTNGNTHGN